MKSPLSTHESADQRIATCHTRGETRAQHLSAMGCGRPSEMRIPRGGGECIPVFLRNRIYMLAYRGFYKGAQLDPLSKSQCHVCLAIAFTFLGLLLGSPILALLFF